MLSKEEEKRIVLLTAIIELGGSATKNQVLDRIADYEFLNLDDWLLEEMKNSRELRWRNDMAFTRKHLVDEGYIDDSKWNYWAVSDTSQAYLSQLVWNL